MKKSVILIVFILGFLFPKAAPISLPDYSKGIDKFVSDYAKVLTPEQSQQIKSRLNDYEKATSVEVAVVLISSVEDYGYTDVTQFAIDLFSKWKIGKAVADNGVIYVIDVRGKHSTIRTGYGVEEKLGSITASDILATVKEKRLSGDFAGAINGVIDGIQKALVGSDAVNKADIAAKTEKKQEMKQDDDLANLGNWLIIIFLFCLVVVAPIAYFVYLIRKRNALKRSVAAALKKKYDDFVALKESMRIAILNGRDTIKSCRGVDNMQSDALDAAEKVINEIDGGEAMRAVGEKEFSEMLNSETQALIMIRTEASAKLNQAVKQISGVQTAINASIGDRKEAFNYETEVNNVIQFGITNKVNAFQSAMKVLNDYPQYLGALNVSAANAAIEKAQAKIAQYKAEAKAFSDEARNLKFAIGVYKDVLGRIQAHSTAIQNSLAGVTDAIVRKSNDLQEAIKGMRQYDDASIERLKQEARSAANRSDVTSSSRSKVDTATAYQPKHTNDILADWVYLQLMLSGIRSATSACNADVQAAEDARERERERIRRAEQAERDRIAAIAAAAAYEIEEANRRERQRQDDYEASQRSNNSNDYGSTSDFGGGGTSGGGASD